MFLHSAITTAVTFGSVLDTGLNFNAKSGDLYSLVGLGSGNNSINWANVSAAFNANFGSTPTEFAVYSVVLNTGVAAARPSSK